MKFDLPNDYNLNAAERLLIELALTTAGSIVDAALLLGITRHALKRRLIKHGIRWNRDTGRLQRWGGEALVVGVNPSQVKRDCLVGPSGIFAAAERRAR